MSSPTAAAWWGLGLLMWAICIYMYVITRRFRASAAAAQRSQECADWARYTMIQVTTADGMIWSESLWEIFRGPDTERRWVNPILITLWTVDRPELYETWQREAIDLYGKRAQEGQG